MYWSTIGTINEMKNIMPEFYEKLMFSKTNDKLCCNMFFLCNTNFYSLIFSPNKEINDCD